MANNIIPPILSDSPPPLDAEQDNNDDPDFGAFGVANAVDFDLSDHLKTTVDVWNTRPNNSSESSDKDHTKHSSLNCLDTYTFDSVMQLPSSEEDISKATILDKRLEIDKLDVENKDAQKEYIDNVNVCNGIEVPNDKEPYCVQVVLDPDPPEILDELDRIPFPSNSQPFNVILEERTSPEGADADSDVGDFNPIISLGNVSSPKSLPNYCSDEKLRSPNHVQPMLLPSESFSEVVVNCSNKVTEAIALPKSLEEGYHVESNHFHSVSYTPPIDFNDDGFHDFADFTCVTAQTVPPKNQSSVLPLSPIFCEEARDSTAPVDVLTDDDFDDFECAVPEIPPEPSVPQSQDIDVEKRLGAIFSEKEDCEEAPSDNTELSCCLNTCLDDSSSVWGRLKDVDASPALSLQWASTSAGRNLLSALSVDSRNILVGQRWNPMVPRFAANIGSSPLEPTKAHLDAKPPQAINPATSADPSSATTRENVPAAQFDWNSSGLTNPLDCVEKEETTFDGQNELTLAVSPGSLPPLDHCPLPLEAPPVQLWHHHLPSTDVLLPPASITPAATDLKISQQLEDLTDIWGSQMTQDGSMSTISSQLDSLQLGNLPSNVVEVVRVSDSETTLNNNIDELNVDKTMPIVRERTTGGLSEEACRVVDALPDLSFLSARKLLFAANDNLSRFHNRP